MEETTKVSIEELICVVPWEGTLAVVLFEQIR